MNIFLVALAMAICLVWMKAEKERMEDIESERKEQIKKDRHNRITRDVRAYARKYKRIDFIIGE